MVCKQRVADYHASSLPGISDDGFCALMSAHDKTLRCSSLI
jgi:hypothetical protein